VGFSLFQIIFHIKQPITDLAEDVVKWVPRIKLFNHLAASFASGDEPPIEAATQLKSKRPYSRPMRSIESLAIRH
jgi:hypothetical protein